MPLSLRALTAVLILALPLQAADPQKDGPTYTSREEADQDYEFCGEYTGFQKLHNDGRDSNRIGFQIVPQGKGKFLGVKYLGGLPGDGWLKGQRFLFEGERVGNGLRMVGAATVLLVSAQRAEVTDLNGNSLGQLTRIERVSPTLGAKPPEGAVVLFDGTSTEHFEGGKLTQDGLLMAGTQTRGAWSHFRMHGEFLLPYKPEARGQNRGNSGFYLQGRYELQVLDSFGLEGIENECGAMYKTRRPMVNMCLPPLTWQTYDIDFAAPEFDEAGNKIAPMTISVWHNGVPIHAACKIPGKTGNGLPEAPEPLPTKLQDHSNPVVYRNLWIVDTSTDEGRKAHWLSLPIKAEPQPVARLNVSPNQF